MQVLIILYNYAHTTYCLSPSRIDSNVSDSVHDSLVLIGADVRGNESVKSTSWKGKATQATCVVTYEGIYEPAALLY